MSDARAPLAIVVAIADGGVIGKDGGLPWRIPEDLQHFKNATMGHAIIMGRKTHDVDRPAAPGTPQHRRQPHAGPRSRAARSPREPRRGDRRSPATTDDEPRIIGGAAIYEAALPLATRSTSPRFIGTVEATRSFHLRPERVARGRAARRARRKGWSS